MTYKVNFVIEKDADGYYAFAPQLKGCHTQGETFEEAHTHIKEAIELYLEILSPEERNLYLNKETFTSSVEVAIG
jgi:predicted RNase H-like HicB family nuclease